MSDRDENGEEIAYVTHIPTAQWGKHIIIWLKRRDGVGCKRRER